jgi:hypothetical protein
LQGKPVEKLFALVLSIAPTIAGTFESGKSYDGGPDGASLGLEVRLGGSKRHMHQGEQRLTCSAVSQSAQTGKGASSVMICSSVVPSARS